MSRNEWSVVIPHTSLQSIILYLPTLLYFIRTVLR